ncbi:MAG TPA: hypothetical protein VLR44_08560, partial [Rhodoferax sp.]|nr:hypothetical protein [Rhodoferax sp.]
MDLLDFARGPALTGALAIFVFGTLWRLIGVLRRPRMPDLSPPRAGAPSRLAGATRAIVRGMWPRKEFRRTALYTAINGYVFHIGLALVFFGYAPHIAFIHRVTGLSWPALPDSVMYVSAGATILSLLLALLLRLTDPVRKMISNADDMISWTLTFLPIATGMAVLSEPSATLLARGHVVYPGP